MKKTIGVITRSDSTVAEHIKENIKLILGDYVTINNYYLNELEDQVINDDVVVVMIKEVGHKIIDQIKHKNALLTIKRTVKSTPMLEVFRIPDGLEVLVVNDNHETTLETMALLLELGVNHIKLIPFKPGQDYAHIAIAITPDEKGYVPRHIESIIDIGQRVIDISTLLQIVNRLGIDQQVVSRKLLDYADGIISLSHGVNKTLLELYSKHEEMCTLLNLSNDGIVLVDNLGVVKQCNAAYKIRFNCEVTDRIEEYLGPKFLKDFSEEAYDEVLYTINKREYLISKKLIRYYGKSTGFSYNFKDVTHVMALEHSMRQQMKTKGFIAKYTFDDIRTRSEKLLQTIEMAKRFAQADLSVLISGESGTGKELFAQSIHNASNRQTCPFVAVNCAAMTESLLESELFGYEGGAFTGALKQGKLGLFERAHQGTIFLDEIGDMPLAMQSKLLRVLQEKQVTRVGGKEVIDVNVRVIAATNKDLYQLVDCHEFRQDLYFRINVLPLEIPPLKDRQEDILSLLNDFSTVHYELSDTVKEFLTNYPWNGNIREIQNVAQYLSFMQNECVGIEELPPYMKRVQVENVNHRTYDGPYTMPFVETMISLYKSKKWSGRMTILKKCRQLGGSETEGDIRKYLMFLKEQHHLIVKEGRGGSMLTETGYKHLNE